jgi:hypothetical protein
LSPAGTTTAPAGAVDGPRNNDAFPHTVTGGTVGAPLVGGTDDDVGEVVDDDVLVDDEEVDDGRVFLGWWRLHWPMYVFHPRRPAADDADAFSATRIDAPRSRMTSAEEIACMRRRRADELMVSFPLTSGPAQRSHAFPLQRADADRSPMQCSWEINSATGESDLK